MGTSETCREAISGGVPGRGAKCPRRGCIVPSIAHDLQLPTWRRFALNVHQCRADVRLPWRAGTGCGIKRANAPRAGKKAGSPCHMGKAPFIPLNLAFPFFAAIPFSALSLTFKICPPNQKALTALKQHAPLIIRRLATKHSSLWMGTSMPYAKPLRREHSYGVPAFSTVGGVDHAHS